MSVAPAEAAEPAVSGRPPLGEWRHRAPWPSPALAQCWRPFGTGGPRPAAALQGNRLSAAQNGRPFGLRVSFVSSCTPFGQRPLLPEAPSSARTWWVGLSAKEKSHHKWLGWWSGSMPCSQWRKQGWRAVQTNVHHCNGDQPQQWQWQRSACASSDGSSPCKPAEATASAAVPGRLWSYQLPWTKVARKLRSRWPQQPALAHKLCTTGTRPGRQHGEAQGNIPPPFNEL